jgi:hypothetical protein
VIDEKAVQIAYLESALEGIAHIAELPTLALKESFKAGHHYWIPVGEKYGSPNDNALSFMFANDIITSNWVGGIWEFKASIADPNTIIRLQKLIEEFFAARRRRGEYSRDPNG